VGDGVGDSGERERGDHRTTTESVEAAGPG
jgi:hypothetical protein